jgi:hypothetical protein
MEEYFIFPSDGFRKQEIDGKACLEEHFKITEEMKKMTNYIIRIYGKDHKIRNRSEAWRFALLALALTTKRKIDNEKN